MAIKTHYDQLKVARDAPAEVIRASYKALSQKYHPDRNPGDPEAARIMQIINAAYACLSDPDKRRMHDAWIKLQETKAAGATASGPKQSPPPGSPPPQSPPPQSPPRPPPAAPKAGPSAWEELFAATRRGAIWIFQYTVAIGVLVLFVWIMGVAFGKKDVAASKPYDASPAADAAALDAADAAVSQYDPQAGASTAPADQAAEAAPATSGERQGTVWRCVNAQGELNYRARARAGEDCKGMTFSYVGPSATEDAPPESEDVPDAADAISESNDVAPAVEPESPPTTGPKTYSGTAYRCEGGPDGKVHYASQRRPGEQCTPLFDYNEKGVVPGTGAAPQPAAVAAAGGPLAAAPNGAAWPAAAGYITGYPKNNADGESTVTVDNAQNDAAVFVKLVSLDGAKARPVRFFFIPAHSRFTVKKVSPGSYDVRYRDLRSGDLARSESFELEQSETQYTTLTMTLYKIAHGNMQTYPLAESEF